MHGARWRWWGLAVGLVGCVRTEPPPDADSDTPADTDGPAETAAPDDSGPTDTEPPEPGGFRWMLHGGGAEDDAVFGAFVAAAGGGRIVTLGAVDDPDDPDLTWWDGYFVGLGADEASTVNTLSPEDGDRPELAAQILAADAIFIRGGDQARYVEHWFGRAVGDALIAAFEAGAVFGGSSAGCALLADRIYDARVASVEPWEVLLDAGDPGLTFTDNPGFGVPGLLTDTHFTERGRLPRLAVFLALHADTFDQAVGLDPQTALLLREDGTGEVVGDGAVTLLRTPRDAVQLTPDGPPDVRGLTMWQLPAGYSVALGAADPVVSRPPEVSDRGAPPALDAFAAVALDGAVLIDGGRAEHLVLPVDDRYAYVDHTLRLDAGRGDLPGLFVNTRVWSDGAVVEPRVAGQTWGLATVPGTIGLLLDETTWVEADAPRHLEVTEGASLVVVDGRAMTGAGARTDGWQAAALEAATLHLVAPGAAIDL